MLSLIDYRWEHVESRIKHFFHKKLLKEHEQRQNVRQVENDFYKKVRDLARFIVITSDRLDEKLVTYCSQKKIIIKIHIFLQSLNFILNNGSKEILSSFSFSIPIRVKGLLLSSIVFVAAIINTFLIKRMKSRV